MDELYSLVVNNIWLFVGLGFVAVLVADELIGFSRSVLGDETVNMPLKPRDAKAPPPELEEDPLDLLEETSEGDKIEDFLKSR